MGKTVCSADVPKNILILFVLYHFGRSYGLEIIKRAKEITDQPVSYAGLYVTLDRLTAQKLISYQWDPGSGPGARRKYFELTTFGRNKCREFLKVLSGPKRR